MTDDTVKTGANIPLLAVGGPTASGKTKLAVELAGSLGGEIICADSMQVYRGMDIGTAAPTAEEKNGIPHHLFGILDPSESFSVARWLGLARRVAADIAARGRLPILCGGTGLYIGAMLDNLRLDESIPRDDAYREELRLLSAGAAWELLRECDPELAGMLHPNNRGRVIRALEAYRQSGVPMSEWQRRSRGEPSPYRSCFIAVEYADREILYDRINRRVDLMLESGLLDEARALLEKNPAGTALQAIGYKELAGYFAGEQTLEEAVEALKRGTRRYAKRQMTWLRRDKRVRRLHPDMYEDYGALLEAALSLVRESGVSNALRR